MKFLAPITIDSTNFTSSTVVETPPTAWNSGTTYAAAGTASTGTAGGIISVWKSAQGSNTNHNPVGDDGTWWTLLNTTYAVWASGTTYADGDTILNATTHRVYEAVQGANTNHDPTTDDGTWWLDIAPTDTWAMFDRSVGTITTGADPLVAVITPLDTFNALALLDMVAASVQVEVDYDGSTLFDQTYTLADLRITMGWWEYMFEPLSRQTDLVVEGLPPVGAITVTINGTECGTLAIGRMFAVGDTRAAPQIGIIDYSSKTTDIYGVTSVTARGYAKRMDISVICDSNRVDGIARKLASIRATPVIWVGDELQKYASLLVYGFFKDWDVVIAYPNISECRLTIEGLT